MSGFTRRLQQSVHSVSGSGNSVPFLIGVDSQQPSSFATWKGRGCNAVARVPQGTTIDSWTTGANQNGLYMLRTARPNPADDSAESLLVAWTQPDEADKGNTDPATLQATYNSLKSTDASRPVFINFSGGVVLQKQTSDNGTTVSDATYQSYIAAADWVSNDIYPVTGWNQPTHLNWVGQAIDKLTGLSSGRPQFAFIETSDQNLTADPSAPGVTPDQFRAEVWDAIVHGARGIIYFPEAFNPFSFDATPSNVVTEMTTQNTTLTALSSVLIDTINPGGMSVNVSTPLEACWRNSGGKKYAIVLNMSSTATNGAAITLSGFGSAPSASVYGESRTVTVSGGVITDDFAAYAVHIYVL
ncbi:MAG TPA: beta-galactosidase [Candidatus Saccharimonadales bacterium]|nr:beta-galactosidase [Candidatus Saccharimonadales bacterium]